MGARGFLAALAFFTRLPAPAAAHADRDALRAAPGYAPVVGWVVGAIGAAGLGLAASVLPLPIAVLASMWLVIRATGALHEDGLADFCDGFGASRERRRVLAVMRDPRIGTHGVVGLVTVLAMKFAALLAIASSPGGVALAAAVLVAGHALSRLACVSLMATDGYAREHADSAFPEMVRPMSAATLALAAVAGSAPLLLLAPAGAAPLALAVVPALLAREWLARVMRRRIGGFTGDCLGAVQQVSELAFYLGACALAPLTR